VAFTASAAGVLPPADVYTQLRVLLEGLTLREPPLLTDEALLARCLRLPGAAAGQRQQAQKPDDASHQVGSASPPRPRRRLPSELGDLPALPASAPRAAPVALLRPGAAA
jgi:hypothetical protein